MSPKKILLVQLFSNGDCLYATAVARQIKQDHPGCHLTWAIAPFCRTIIDNNPYVDEILVTDKVNKNDVAALRRFKRELQMEKDAGKWDEVFVTTNLDTNLAYYDGTIRGMILRAYGRPITAPAQPVLELTSPEKNNVESFAARHQLVSFKHVVLWEYAPQSGQAAFDFEETFELARELTVMRPDLCIVLSSPRKFESTTQVVDASVLTLRENAALTHYCDLLIGSSSGITWITTSSAAKFLPMLQLLDPTAAFINKASEDFARYNIAHQGIIEMDFRKRGHIKRCIETIIDKGFQHAEGFNEVFPLQFNTSRKIFYNLMVYREFAAMRRHIAVMESAYGRLPALRRILVATIAMFPFKLTGNLFRKKILAGRRSYF